MNGPAAVVLAALLALTAAVAAVPVGVADDGATAGGQAGGFVADDASADGRTGGFRSDAGERSLGVASRPVVSQSNTTEYLAIPASSVRTERFGTARLSVSDALDADVGRLTAAFTGQQLSRAYVAAGTDAERRRVLRRAADRLATRIDTLESRERDALAAYNAGEITTTEYLRQLAVHHVRAEAIRQAVLALNERAERTDRSPVTTTEIARFDARLLPLRGPVRNRIAQVVEGDEDTFHRFYVETSSSAVILAMVHESEGRTQYVREAYLADNRRPAQPDSFGGSIFAAFDRFKDIYPWAWNHQDGFSSGSTELRHVGVYQFTVVHPQGELTAYLDGGTNTTYLEYQHKTVSEIPTGTTVSNVSDGLRLVVNRSRTGGPLEIRVVNATTGEPVDASITVDEHSLGRTGADGRLWTIAPPVRFTVVATINDRRVSVDTFSRRNV